MSAPAVRSAARISFDASLAEEAVLLAEPGLSDAEREAFRSERDRIYDASEPEERDARFEELHGRWFVRLGLDRPLYEALAERPELLGGGRSCRVLRAATRQQELADLCLETGHSEPTIVLRLRPETLLGARALLELLRRELSYVADMLDPGFGYRPELEASNLGAAHDRLLRERYRVVWDATIDGRLVRRGWLPSGVADSRRAEFVRAFASLGDEASAAFASWFERQRPTHAEIAAFVGATLGDDACCPACRLPSARRFAAAPQLGAQVLSELRRDVPSWREEQGLCPQCADLYAARATR